MESKSVPSKQEKDVYNEQLNARRCFEFSVKRPGDKLMVSVKGVLCVSDKVVVVDRENDVMKLFDQNGIYLSSTELKYHHDHDVSGITCVHGSTFATCAWSNSIYLWTIHGQTIVRENVSYNLDQWADGIFFNGTYYCVLHNDNNDITVLDRRGRQVRQITMKEAFGMKFDFGWDIHMDSETNNIYLPCDKKDGVLCMTIEGQALWFTPVSGPWGITEIRGTLCVAGYGGRCLHVITKDGEYIGKLLDKNILGSVPRNVCYGNNDKLYVTYVSGDKKHDKITVYSII